MANNQYVNKVVNGESGDVLIDLTADTITASSLMQGYTAHDKSGAPIVGTSTGGSMVIRDEQDSHGGTIRHITAGSVVTGTVEITENGTYDVAQYADASVSVPAPEPELQSKSATPSETAQTITPDSGYDGLSSVSVGAISNTYVGSGITRRSSSNLTVSGATVTAPAGYYENSASKSVASGSASTPATTITANPTISVDSTTGEITATVSGSKSVTPTVSAGYVSSGTAGTITVSGSNMSQLSTQSGTTVSPTESEQTAVAAGKYTTGAVKVSAISSTYVGSGIDRNDSTDLSASGATVSVPAGYYASSASKSVASGSVSASATKSISSHTAIVTPSASVTAGYVSSGATGTAVTVTASELASGNKSITANGTDIDVVGYSTVSVAVPVGMSATDLKSFIQRNSTFTDITWPSGLSSIGAYTFGGLDYFNPSSLPSGVTKIYKYAFINCTRMELSSLPSGVTTIGEYAFRDCTNLALSSLPSGLTYIGQYAFYSCSNITIDSLPSGLTAIEQYVFYGCSKLALTSLPSGVTSIGTYAFRGCSALVSITCSGSIATLGAYAFNSCSNLESVEFPNMAISSLDTVFGNTSTGSACKKLEVADLGSTQAIAANAFANCYKLQTLVLRRSNAICALSSITGFYNTPMRGYNSLTGTVYVPNALISTYQTATNWKTLYDAGTVTFTAIEGSDYELE